MRNYDYKKLIGNSLTPEIVEMLTRIHEYKGEQNLYLDGKADTLNALLEIAKIQSAEASNKIEGIYTSEERLKQIVLDKTIPKTRSEEEIAGYRDVLKTIHENYQYLPLKPSFILQLHRDLYKYSGQGHGGKYKTNDNIITQENENGEKFIRFVPVEAWETPTAIEGICSAYNQAVEIDGVDALLAIPATILDFLSVHPFNDGNGRLSRLLTLLLLYRAGYHVGKYISIEKQIEKTKESYYDALHASSVKWHEETNDYKPFIRYMLGVILAAYREFNERVNIWSKKPLAKTERVAEIIKNTLGTITKKQIVEQCPDIAEITVQRTLAELVEKGDVIKIGGGRYTKYVWNADRK